MSVAAIAGGLVAGHLVTRPVWRYGNRTRFMSGLRAKGFALGLRRALEGKPTISIPSRLAGAIVRPELSTSQQVGHAAGMYLRRVPAWFQVPVLKGARWVLSQTPRARGDLLDDAISGVGVVLRQPLPVVKPMQPKTSLDRMVTPLLLGVAATHPAAASAVGVNMLGQWVGNTALFDRLVRSEVRAGLSGRPRGRVPLAAMEYLISPEATQPYLMGRQARNIAHRLGIQGLLPMLDRKLTPKSRPVTLPPNLVTE